MTHVQESNTTVATSTSTTLKRCRCCCSPTVVLWAVAGLLGFGGPMLVTSVFRRESPETPISEAIWIMLSGRALSLLVMTLLSLRHWNCRKSRPGHHESKAAADSPPSTPDQYVELSSVDIVPVSEKSGAPETESLQSDNPAPVGVDTAPALHTTPLKVSDEEESKLERLVPSSSDSSSDEVDQTVVEDEILKETVTVKPKTQVAPAGPAVLIRARTWAKLRGILEFKRSAKRLREWQGAHCLAGLARLSLPLALVPVVVPIFKGIGYVFYTILMGRGDVSLYSAVAGSYNLIPVMYGLTCRREKRSWNKLLGIVLSTLAVLSVGLSEAFSGSASEGAGQGQEAGAGQVVVNVLLVLSTLVFWGVGDTITSYWGKKVPMRATLFLGMLGNLVGAAAAAVVMRLEIAHYFSTYTDLSLDQVFSDSSLLSLAVWKGDSNNQLAVGIHGNSNMSLPLMLSTITHEQNCTHGVQFDTGDSTLPVVCLDDSQAMALSASEASLLSFTIWHVLLFVVNFGPVVGWLAVTVLGKLAEPSCYMPVLSLAPFIPVLYSLLVLGEALTAFKIAGISLALTSVLLLSKAQSPPPGMELFVLINLQKVESHSMEGRIPMHR